MPVKKSVRNYQAQIPTKQCVSWLLCICALWQEQKYVNVTNIFCRFLLFKSWNICIRHWLYSFYIILHEMNGRFNYTVEMKLDQILSHCILQCRWGIFCILNMKNISSLLVFNILLKCKIFCFLFVNEECSRQAEKTLKYTEIVLGKMDKEKKRW